MKRFIETRNFTDSVHVYEKTDEGKLVLTTFGRKMLRRIVQRSFEQNEDRIPSFFEKNNTVTELFDWRETREGMQYWKIVAKQLNERRPTCQKYNM